MLITALAFVIRLGVCAELCLSDSNVLHPSKLSDMWTYLTLAKQILAGTYSGVFYYQPFYYVIFLPSIIYVFGNNIYLILVVQAAIGALTVLFSGLSARFLWGKAAGIFTAILLLFSSVLIFYTSFLLVVTLQAFWISVLLNLVIIALKKHSFVFWGMSGIILGGSILTVGNMWLFFPVIFLFALWNGFENNNKLRIFLPAMVFLFFTFLPIWPFIYHNTKILGKLSGPSTAAGAVLSYGNTPESSPGGNEPCFGAGIVNQSYTQKYWLMTADKIPFYKRILNYFISEPLSYIELTFRKLLLFWDYREIPNNVDINIEKNLSQIMKYFGFIGTYVFVILGLSGMIICFPRKKKHPNSLLPFCLVVTYWISVSMFYILDRFRAPIIPLLAIYGGAFLAYLFSREARKIRHLLLCVFLIFSFSFFTFFSYDDYRYNLEAKIMRFVRPFGTVVDMDNCKMILDNGPVVFGSWGVIKLNPYDIICKNFRSKNSSVGSNAIFELPLYFKTPGLIKLEINGKIFTVPQKGEGLYDNKFEIPLTIDKKNISLIAVKIKTLKASGNVYCLADYQRNYNRTSIGNVPINAELVCRLFLYNTL